jgi:hypothetical protein
MQAAPIIVIPPHTHTHTHTQARKDVRSVEEVRNFEEKRKTVIFFLSYVLQQLVDKLFTNTCDIEKGYSDTLVITVKYFLHIDENIKLLFTNLFRKSIRLFFDSFDDIRTGSVKDFTGEHVVFEEDPITPTTDPNCIMDNKLDRYVGWYYYGLKFTMESSKVKSFQDLLSNVCYTGSKREKQNIIYGYDLFKHVHKLNNRQYQNDLINQVAPILYQHHQLLNEIKVDIERPNDLTVLSEERNKKRKRVE